MGERRADACTSFKRELELAVAPPPGRKMAAPTCVSPKRAAVPPATQTRAGQGFRDCSSSVKNSSSAAAGGRGGDGSRGSAATGGAGAALVRHGKAAVAAGDDRDSSQDVLCGKSDAAASAAMNRATSAGVTRGAGPAASFKRTVSIKDRETAGSCRAAAAGDDACIPKASPGTNKYSPKPSSGASASTGRDKDAAVAGAGDRVAPKPPDLGTNPNPSSGASASTGRDKDAAVAGAGDRVAPKPPDLGTNPNPSSGASSAAAAGSGGVKKRGRCVVLFDEPWRSPLQKPKLAPPSPRQAVRERLRRFRELAMEGQRGGETKPDLKALNALKQSGGVPTRRYLGEVPGVEVGDEFNYRSELMVAGLHGSPFGGIDSMADNGRKVATCVISAKRYVDAMEGSDVLEYCGEGGIPGCCWENNGRKEGGGGDQRLDRGNLALKNSMEAQTPVRVVHGFEVPRDGGESLESRAKTVMRYVYDGLYRVEDFWWETAAAGSRVLKFRLRRMPGQRELELKEVWRRPGGGRDRCNKV